MLKNLTKYFFKAFRKFIIRSSFLMPSVQKHLPRLFTGVEAFNKSLRDSTFNTLKILCREDQKSIDIGVLWGAYAVKIAKYSKQLHCFEPNTICYNHLKRIFRADTNEDGNVILHNIALSNSRGQVFIRIPKNSFGNATIESKNTLDTFGEVINKKIKKARLDDYSITNVGFIKIDVEGHEYKALLGAKETIQQSNPILLVEVEERHNEGAVERVVNFIQSLGYDTFFIKGKMVLNFKYYSIEEHQNNILRNTADYINNFIFIHSTNIETMKLKFAENGYDVSNMNNTGFQFEKLS